MIAEFLNDFNSIKVQLELNVVFAPYKLYYISIP